MRKNLGLTLGVLLVAGSVLASNTGFKLNYTLHKKGSNNNWTSFPFFYYPNGNVGDPQNSFTACFDLNEGNVGAGAKVTAFVRWDSVNDRAQSVPCNGSGIGAFPLKAGDGYSLRPLTDGVVVNIVGSMDDTYAFNKIKTNSVILHKKGSNNNWTSIPYHEISNNSVELCREAGINPAFPTLVVTAVVRWDSVNDRAQSFPCNGTIGSFLLNPGDALSMRPASEGVPVQFSVY